jgi:UDP-glucose 4-epimerase
VKHALITGGAGFIGSHLAESLIARDYRVTVVDDLSSGDAARVAGEADLRRIDIVDRAALDAVVDEVAPRAIFHLAAQEGVTASLADPGRDCAVNVQGTLNVLEAAGRHRAPLVFTSTGGALYGDEAPIPTPEDRIPAPLSPYGASKWAGEAYVDTWSAASGIARAWSACWARYGPPESPRGGGVVAIHPSSAWPLAEDLGQPSDPRLRTSRT